MKREKAIYRALLALGMVLALAGCEDVMETEPPVELLNFEVASGPVWPDLSADLHNTSSKTIQAVSWWATFLDGHNQTAYGLLDDSVANLVWQRSNIAPGATVRGTWTLTWFDLAVQVDESGLCKVTFTDGSQWEPSTHEPNC